MKIEKAIQKKIIDHYLAPYTNGRQLSSGELILSPFREERNASFNIYETDSGWNFKDFAGEQGDCFKLVMLLFTLSFKDAVKKIREELVINIGKTGAKPIPQLKDCQIIYGQSYRVYTREFTEMELNWWSQYFITQDILKLFGVLSIELLEAVSKKRNRPYSLTSDVDQFVFGYPYSGTCLKVYKPQAEKFRFFYVDPEKRDNNFVFGFKQLPETGNIVYWTGGEKDVMTLTAMGFYAITGTSETGYIPDEIIEELRRRKFEIIILFDNDATGMDKSDKFSKQYGIRRIVLPVMENGKDISDYAKLKLPKEAILNLTEKARIQSKESRLKDFRELAKDGENLPAMKRVFGDFIFEKTTVLFPSERGVGKTFFALELAIAVSSEWKSFCGEPIEIHGNVLYLNYELGEYAMKKRLASLYKDDYFADFHKYAPYCISERGSLSNNMEEIVKYVKEKKPVLVVIDNLRAAFSDKDNEKNSEMTNTIMELNKLKDAYGFALLLVHHTKKGTSNKPTESDLQSGAGALSDLSDGDFFLRKSKQDKQYRLLRREKSRYCEAQDGAKLLYMNPQTLWFECLEDQVDELEHLGRPEKNSSENRERAKEMKDQGLTLQVIADELGVNKSTVSRWLKAKE